MGGAGQCPGLFNRLQTQTFCLLPPATMPITRMRMRPWLEMQINSNQIPGLIWINKVSVTLGISGAVFTHVLLGTKVSLVEMREQEDVFPSGCCMPGLSRSDFMPSASSSFLKLGRAYPPRGTVLSTKTPSICRASERNLLYV